MLAHVLADMPGHLALVPRLLGWEYAGLAPDVRKTFEVALHAGSAPALLVALRRRGLGELRHLWLTLLPPVLVGGVFEGALERRLVGPILMKGRLVTETWLGDPLDPPLATAADYSAANGVVLLAGVTAAAVAAWAIVMTAG